MLVICMSVHFHYQFSVRSLLATISMYVWWKTVFITYTHTHIDNNDDDDDDDDWLYTRKNRYCPNCSGLFVRSFNRLCIALIFCLSTVFFSSTSFSSSSWFLFYHGPFFVFYPFEFLHNHNQICLDVSIFAYYFFPNFFLFWRCEMVDRAIVANLADSSDFGF